MPSHPKSYKKEQRLHSLVQGWTWWLRPNCSRGVIAPSLMIQNAYTEMCNDSKSIPIMVKNGMAYPQILKKKILIARVVAANCVPEAQMQPGTMDALNEVQGIQIPQMTTEERQEKLFKKLDLSGLGSWPLELADFTHSLPAEYHDIFSSESCELGCTYSTEHVIRVTDDTPLKECCWWKKSVHTCRRCWIQAWFTPARVHGVMPQCWFKRRMGVYISA